MDINVFNGLPLNERAQIAWDNAKHLKTLGEKEKCFSVYSFSDYYIIVHYDADSYDIKWVKAVKSDKKLDDFIKELNLLDSDDNKC